MDKVSVIVNSYQDKREAFDIAIPSILNQSGVEIHLILSTVKGDPCLKWIKEYKGDIDVVTMHDHGERDPDNSFKQLANALSKIKHRWTCFASADDPLMLDKFYNETQLLAKSGKMVCYSARLDVDENYNVLRKVEFPKNYSYKEHLKGNFVSDISMVWSGLFEKYMPFRTKWYNCGYWDLWLRIYEGEGNVFIYNKKPVTKYVMSGISMHLAREKDLKKKRRYEKARVSMIQWHKSNGNTKRG